MKSIKLENNEIILINGKIYIGGESSFKGCYTLECIDDLISPALKNEIIINESNGKEMNVKLFDFKYGKRIDIDYKNRDNISNGICHTKL